MTFKLGIGLETPLIGYGLGSANMVIDHNDVVSATSMALKNDFYHLDCTEDLDIILQCSNFLPVFSPVFAPPTTISGDVCEFAYASLHEDAATGILQPNTTAGKAAEFMLSQVLKQPGARHAQWALTEENPRQIRIWADWDSVQDHLNYQQTEVYAEVQKQLFAIFDLSAPFSVCYLEPSNTALFLTDADTHPAVEILTMRFPDDMSSAVKAAVEAQFQDFADKALRLPGRCKSILTAWSVESNVRLPGLETGSGAQNGTVYSVLIPGRSPEEHEQNKELPTFKEHVHLLKTLPGLVSLEVVYVVDVKSGVADKVD